MRAPDVVCGQHGDKGDKQKALSGSLTRAVSAYTMVPISHQATK